MASQGDIVLSYYDTLLRKSDVELLSGRAWINDNIISFWFDYLQHDLYAEYSDKIVFLSPQVTHFIKSAADNENNLNDVKTMLSTMDFGEKQLIIIPVNDCHTDNVTVGGTHWSLLVYFDNKQSFEHYDSHTGSINRLHAENLVTILSEFLIADHESDIELDLNEMECTQQTNSYDCGVYLLCNAEAVCRQFFLNDNRHICDISSVDAVKQARRDINRLIYSIKEKTKKSSKPN